MEDPRTYIGAVVIAILDGKLLFWTSSGFLGSASNFEEVNKTVGSRGGWVRAQ